MHRREFINMSGIGIISMNGMFKFSFFNDSDHEVSIIDNFMEFIRAEKKEGPLDVNLFALVAKNAESYLKTGYANIENNYWLSKNNTILYPLCLSTDDLKYIDQVILVFEKEEEKGNFVYRGSLNKFHLAAIHHNKEHITKIAKTNDFIEADLLLPSKGGGKYIKGGWAFATNKGFFELAVTLNNDNASIYSALIADQSDVWRNTIDLKSSTKNKTV